MPIPPVITGIVLCSRHNAWTAPSSITNLPLGARPAKIQRFRPSNGMASDVNHVRPVQVRRAPGQCAGAELDDNTLIHEGCLVLPVLAA